MIITRSRSEFSSFLLASVLLLALLFLDCAPNVQGERLQVGDINKLELTSETPAAESLSPEGDLILRTWEISKEDASYIAVHFRHFNLLEDERVVIRNRSGEEQYELTGEGKQQSGGRFWAQHVKGNKMVIELWAPVESDLSFNRFAIHEQAFGFPLGNERDLLEDDEPQWGLFRKLACGANDRQHAKCYETSHPEHYKHSKGVARLLIQGAWMCTGWLASADDHLITNQHCIESGFDALNTDFEFDAEAPDCSYSQGQFQTPGVIYSGADMLKYDIALDYAIVKVNGNPSSHYPHFEFDPTAQIADGQAFSQAIQDTPIYIPQHSFGYDKELALVSTHPDDIKLGESVCHILAFDWAACTAFGGYLEVGYYCDTEPGSSGSPVVSSLTHQVVSLNHCGCNNCACHNLGVPINEIYSDICMDSCTCGLWGCCADGGAGNPSTCDDSNTPPAQNSCDGNCGGSAGTCWCDSLCVTYGDCCSDVCDHCGIDCAIDGPAADHTWDSFYYTYHFSRSFSDAESDCVSQGMHLASVGSAEELEDIKAWINSLGYGAQVYIGLNDEAIEGTWSWTDWSTVDFTNWAAGEPNDYDNPGMSPGEDCVEMYAPSLQWNDIPCELKRHYLCKGNAAAQPTDSPFQPTVVPTVDPTSADDGLCNVNGDSCNEDGDCCSAFCKVKKNGQGICKKPVDDCIPTGESCTKSNKCCSGKCNKDANDKNDGKFCVEAGLRHRWV